MHQVNKTRTTARGYTVRHSSRRLPEILSGWTSRVSQQPLATNPKTPWEFAAPHYGDMGRGLVGLGVCVAGAGILACFAAVGALGMLGQRCAALWPTAAQLARQLTAP
jgi:hypothetical protein